MTKKVQVSQHQARILDKISQLGYETALTKQEICDAILHGYESKTKFKPGDKVIKINDDSDDSIVYMISYLSPSGSIAYLESPSLLDQFPSFHVENLRLATPEEISSSERRQSEERVERIIEDLNKYEHFILREKLAKLYEGGKK